MDLWLTLRLRSVRPVLSYRNVLPKKENGMLAFTYALIRIKSMCPSGGEGVWSTRRKGATYGRQLKPQSAR